MLKRTLFFLFIIYQNYLLFSQLEKGDKYYANYEFKKAISCYKKATKSDSTSSQIAYIKLGNIYKKINEYANAENSYKKALSINIDVSPDVYYNYAQVLKANTKYDLAIEQYSNYIKLSPNDENAKNAAKFCKEITYYKTKPIEYDVKNIDKINSSKSEFCPFIYNGKLMFVAEKEEFNFDEYSVDGNSGEPFLKMFITSVEGIKTEKVKLISSKINTEYHNGPGCLSSDGKSLYFTRVDFDKRKKIVNKAKILFSNQENNKWSNVKEFEYNDENYSVAHPNISSDNTKIFFTSDMPGGFGGKDIWMCLKEPTGWSKPINLGPDINTSGDEMFPSMRYDGILFFCSNGLPGYGGMDIYSAKSIEDKWLLIRNEGINLNSNLDDFGITFLNDSIGYFSSNRIGGKGKDDIYIYRFTNKSISVSGTILLSDKDKTPAKNVKVTLTDSSGIAINTTKTNAEGFFEFKNLDSDKKYLAVIDEENDVNFIGKARYFLADNKGNIQRVTNNINGNKFVFRNLPLSPNGLPELAEEDKISFSGKILLTENIKNPAPKVNVVLYEESGVPVDTTTTNEDGVFEFKNLSADKKYLAIVEENNPEFMGKARYFMADNKGNIQRVTNNGKGSKFVFKNLPFDANGLPDMYTEDTLTIAGNLLYGEKSDKILKNAKIKLVNEFGDVVIETTTNEFGAFAFRNIPSDQNYLITIEESDVSFPENTKITLTNKNGKQLKTFYTGSKEKFNFKILSSDKNLITEMDAEDVNLVMDVYGYIYDQNKKPISRIKIKVNSNDVKEQVTSNENGKFNFKNLKGDENYLFEIDENDPSFKGITKIFIADAKGRIYKVIERNNNGKFSFKIMDADKVAMGEFVLEDPTMLSARIKKKENYNTNKTEKADPEKLINGMMEKGEKELKIIEYIYYKYGSFKVDSLSEKTIDKIISAMKKNSNLNLEIGSHTDSRSSAEFNLELSNKRAQTVMDYILANGISRSRLKATGYGETKLLNNCGDNVECSEDDHKMNRRTEFIIKEKATN